MVRLALPHARLIERGRGDTGKGAPGWPTLPTNMRNTRRGSVHVATRATHVAEVQQREQSTRGERTVLFSSLSHTHVRHPWSVGAVTRAKHTCLGRYSRHAIARLLYQVMPKIDGADRDFNYKAGGVELVGFNTGVVDHGMSMMKKDRCVACIQCAAASAPGT